MNQTTDKALNVRGATKTYGTQSGGLPTAQLAQLLGL